MLSLIKNFFTHKDFLPPAAEIPGTLFTPLHFIFSAFCITAVIFFAIKLSKKSEDKIRLVFAILWVTLITLEATKIIWESLSGAKINFEWRGMLPLYPCSIFMYALPFAIWGKKWVRDAACGYVCSLGFLGGAINFVYPANILGRYSCISFAGFHTFFYHGSLVMCALVMIMSGYHSYTKTTSKAQLFLPSLPFLCMSIVANVVNYSKIDSDYMFFKLESFIFAPLGAATADWIATILVYAAYIFIHALPYIPFYIKNNRRCEA